MPRKRFPLMISDYERSQLLSIATTFKISEARAARLAIVLLAKNLENEDFCFFIFYRNYTKSMKSMSHIQITISPINN